MDDFNVFMIEHPDYWAAWSGHEWLDMFGSECKDRLKFDSRKAADARAKADGLVDYEISGDLEDVQ